MFTGLIADLGHVLSIAHRAEGVRLRIGTALARELSAGDSVAVNGVCLTAAAFDPEAFEADVMPETLRRSSLAELEPGGRVNLELPLRPSDRLGGHVVQGHVDGLGRIAGVRPDGLATVLDIEADAELLRYVVPKGSIALDGVSLTVVEVGDSAFSVSLIPETRSRTSLGEARPGRRVNLEVDVLAKYVERLVAHA